MAGKCMAYQSAVNPVPEPLNINVDTSALGAELATVENMKKLYEERSKALKDALILRHERGDETVKDFCSIVESKSTVYPAASVLNRIIPEIVWEAVKSEKYRFLLDITNLTENLFNSIISILPDTLTPQSIPEVIFRCHIREQSILK
jgi:tRNA C32,U32 (ribose-2'-O)-methylase TrmJ